MKKEKEEFDERQLQIRKNIFKHGFLVAIGALLLNAFLNSMNIVWASTFDQNIIIFFLIITVVSIEFHVNDVYFGKGVSRVPIISLFGFLGIILVVLSGTHFAQGATFIVNGGLTDEGARFICSAMLLSNALCGIVQYLRNNRTEKQTATRRLTIR